MYSFSYPYQVLSSSVKRSSPSSSPQSDDEQPLAKRRRITEDKDEDEDEEDEEPLAIARANAHSAMVRAENGQKSTNRRKTASMKTKAHTAPMSIAPPTGEVQAAMNGELPPTSCYNQPPVKVEEQMDESQLDRLATGVTVDTEGVAPTAVSITPPHLPCVSSTLFS